MRFMVAYFDQITAWADWALEVTGGWEDATAPAQTWAAQARDIFAGAARPVALATPGTGPAGPGRLS